MLQPTLLNDGEKKVKKFTTVLMWLCLSLSIILFFVLVFLFKQHQQIKLMQGKTQNDSTAIQSYKDLLLTQ